jgi:hypothetical protein
VWINVTVWCNHCTFGGSQKLGNHPDSRDKATSISCFQTGSEYLGSRPKLPIDASNDRMEVVLPIEKENSSKEMRLQCNSRIQMFLNQFQSNVEGWNLRFEAHAMAMKEDCEVASSLLAQASKFC